MLKIVEDIFARRDVDRDVVPLVGGYFGETGRKPTLYFGRWSRPTLGVPSGDGSTATDILRLRELPGDGIEIAFPGAPDAELALFDLRGEMLWRMAPESWGMGEIRVVLERDRLPAGVYICRYRGAGRMLSRTLLIR